MCRKDSCRAMTNLASSCRSVGRRSSFDPPVAERAFLAAMLAYLIDRACSWLRFQHLAARGLLLTIRYGDYEGAQGRESFREPTADEALLREAARDRFERLYQRRLPLRFLGVELAPLVAPPQPPLLFHDAEEETALFLSRARVLGPKLGPILLQMGPDFGIAELPALATYLATLPRDLRFAIEFRQRSWIVPEVAELLTEHRVSLALSDGRWIPRETVLRLAELPTADFHYIRWMGPDRAITDFSRIQFDRSREVELWGDALSRIVRAGRDIYGYVNNHFAGHSPQTARELQRLVGQEPVDPGRLGEQISLF